MWTRREVVLGGILGLVWIPVPSFTCRAQTTFHSQSFGCTLSDKDAASLFGRAHDTRLYITGNEPIIPKSGDKDFDFALAHTLAKVSGVLGVSPGFAYYDDYDGLNAYATPKPRLNGADGTVLFGQRLLKRLMSSNDNPGVGVASVCAHEFGHILQYKRGLIEQVGAGQPTVKRIELQADFFAGYFAGIRKIEKPDFPAAVFAMTQYNFGDNMVNHTNHHGTPDERAAAIVRGFEVAFQERKLLAEAIQISINYVATL